jgi:RHS repeat-associated protein/uncharacterized repeat protein (TIGR01451 family)
MTSPQGTWSYSYDGLGNRLGKVENGTSTQYVIDPIGLGNVVGEYNSSGSLIAHYDHAFDLLSRIDSSGNVAGYAFDGNGNAQQLVSSAGTVLNSYAYSPFGRILLSRETIPNSFKFVGQYGVMHEDNGLEYMRSRYYNSEEGRFLTSDPIGLGGGDLNLYRYVFNSPLDFVDPVGTDKFSNFLLGVIGGGSIIVALTTTAPLWVPATLFVGGCVLVRESFSGGTFIAQVSNLVIDKIWGELSGNYNQFFNIYNILFPSASADDLPDPSTPLFNPDGTGNGGDPEPSISPPETPSGGPGGSSPVTPSMDPNSLTGPAGYGAAGYIAANTLLSYRINFENASNAAAPAQQVNITDQLSTNYDWTTFNVSEFGFGDLVIPLPPGTQEFQTNMPFSYLGTNFQVQIQIGINLTSGQVYANFQSIDPNTSLPPPVNIGFLPPEDGTGRGMGHVTYTVRAKSGLPSGTQLNNVALISFDEQTSIATDQIDDSNPAAGINSALECLITLDSIPPTSSVLPLPAQSQLLQIPVSWTGQDYAGGPGIASYNIYVSDNGGSWTNWLSGTTSTNATFQGKPQHAYGFTSQAMDNAGLLETQHTNADATTTIIANPQFQFTVTPTSTNLTTNTTFSYTITVKNIGTLNLENVTMSNTMPAGIDLDYVEYGLGSCDIGDGSIVWSLGNMNTNANASMSITADAASNGIWTNLFAVADSQGAASASAVQILTIGMSTPIVLSIALTNNQVLLSWPSSVGNYGLQVTTNIVSTASWGAVSNAPTTNGSTISVTIPVTQTNQYFRLQSH